MFWLWIILILVAPLIMFLLIASMFLMIRFDIKDSYDE